MATTRQVSSGFLLPRERERLDNKKRKEISQESYEASALPPSQPPPPPSFASYPPYPSFPPPPAYSHATQPFPPSSYPPPPPPNSLPNQQSYSPLNPMLFVPHPPSHTLTQANPINNVYQQRHGHPSQFPPLPPQQILNPHFKPLPQIHPQQRNFPPYQNNHGDFSQSFSVPPHPFPSATPSSFPASPFPPSTTANHTLPPLPHPSSPIPARRAPEFAVVLEEALRNGIRDAETIYGLLRVAYDQMQKETRVNGLDQSEAERTNGTDVDECDERLMQEMMHLMSVIPLSPAAAQRPLLSQRGVIPGVGELMNSDCDVFIHCCNCYHKMGAGIAKSISEKYPCVAEADRMSPKGNRGKLGHFTSALTPDGKTFINLYAQFQYGHNDGQRKLSYKALRLGLQRITERLRNQNAYPKVGSYYMGCYHAGGDKEKVKQIFNETFYDRPVYIFSQITFTDPARQITNKFYNYNQNTQNAIPNQVSSNNFVSNEHT